MSFNFWQLQKKSLKNSGFHGIRIPSSQIIVGCYCQRNYEARCWERGTLERILLYYEILLGWNDNFMKGQEKEKGEKVSSVRNPIESFWFINSTTFSSAQRWTSILPLPSPWSRKDILSTQLNGAISSWLSNDFHMHWHKKDRNSAKTQCGIP